MKSVLLIMSVLLVGCIKEPILPMEEDLFKKVLYDKYVAEAALDRVPEEKRDSLYTVYNEQIMKRWNVSSSDFDESLLILRADLKRF